MKRRHAILAAITAPVVAALGCGYPAFTFGPGGTGTGGATSSSSTGGASTAGPSSGSGGSLIPCPIAHLLISEIRSRGPDPVNGGDDEFVELYNPTAAAIALDANWVLEGRTADPSITDYSTRWVGGAGYSIPAHGHFLIGGGAYTQSPASDAQLSVAIKDAASLRLLHAGATVDAVCYYHQGNIGMASTFVNFVYPYSCEGFPAANPHDDTTTSNKDASLERTPGGTLGNCADSGDNSADFITQSPSTPQNSHSTPAP